MKHWLLILVVILILSACKTQVVDQPTVEIDPTETAIALPVETPTATSEPPKSLTICTSELPESLFPYDGVQFPIKNHLLSLIYENPFRRIDGELTAGILDKVPTQLDGDLRLEPVFVQRGQIVVNAEGTLVVLKEGALLRPSGCFEAGCAITWNGQDPLEMDQMVVDFRFRDGITWSDGVPVTAADSELSFQMSMNSEPPGLNWVAERTESFKALDDQMVQWIGKPGFTTAQLEELFWRPLPSHLLTLSEGWEAMASDPDLQMAVLSYGPYVVSASDDGLLSLIPNSHYFGSQEGLPNLDEIHFRQVDGDAQAAWSALQSGACDVLDTSFDLAGSPGVLEQARADDRYDLVIESGSSWTQLVFGIKPASYDDFYNPQVGDRPDLLGDPRTRQAILHCLDRQTMLESTVGGQTQVWQSFLPFGKSIVGQNAGFSYDPQKAGELLQAVGWVDHDRDPSTPLVAYAVANLPAGTQLALELLVSPSGFHQDLAQIIQANLSACGIGMTVTSLPEDVLYAPGPEGPLFGRQFDLALIAWQPHPALDCMYYQSAAIPSSENLWIGTNIAGLVSEVYDRTCQDAILSLPGVYDQAVLKAEEAFLEILPAVPLFSVPNVMILPASDCFGAKIQTELEFFMQIPSLDPKIICP